MIEWGHMEIRKAVITDARALADIHVEQITYGFLSTLGVRFLVLFYTSFIHFPAGFCFIIEEQGEVRGFIAGVTSMKGFYKAFLRQYGVQAVFVLIPKILNLRKILESLIYAQKEEMNQIFEEINQNSKESYHKTQAYLKEFEELDL